MASLKAIVVVGSVREGRMAERISTMVVNELRKQEFEIRLFDPKELDLPLLRQPLHFMKDRSSAPSKLIELDQMIQDSDCFIIISAEYNCGVPPALSNTLDYFPPSSYRHKPAALVTYSMGSFGGARAGCILRPFLSELGMVSIPSYLVIPSVNENVSEDGLPKSERIEKNLTKVLTELKWYASAVKAHKDANGAPN